jgi:hypothetical protein
LKNVNRRAFGAATATSGTPTFGGEVVTPEAHKALWGSALGYAMDGFDLLILSFMLREISADWRGMFVLGIFPAGVAYCIRRTLHEPDLFIAHTTRKPKPASRLRLLVKDRPTTNANIALAILCSVQNFGKIRFR